MGRHGFEDIPVSRARKRRAAGQQLVERAAQAVDVGTNVDRMRVGNLLRCDVLGMPITWPKAVVSLPGRPSASKMARPRWRILT